MALRYFTGQERSGRNPHLFHMPMRGGTDKLSLPEKQQFIKHLEHNLAAQQIPVGWDSMTSTHCVLRLPSPSLRWFWAHLPCCSSISQARSFGAGSASSGSCRTQPGRRWRAGARTSAAGAGAPPSASQTSASWGWWNGPPSECL